jgi:hypothetical protein
VKSIPSLSTSYNFLKSNTLQQHTRWNIEKSGVCYIFKVLNSKELQNTLERTGKGLLPIYDIIIYYIKKLIQFLHGVFCIKI